MPRSAVTPSPRLAACVTPPADRATGVDLSQASEPGLAVDGAEARRRRWLEENRAAMDAYNEYIAEHGLPLAEFRRF